MHRSFEPNRLSPTFLAQAYEKIVSYQIRVIRFERDKVVDQDEGDQTDPARRVL